MCFEVMSYGKTVLQKTLFAIFTAIILGLIYSSFQWADKQENKSIIFLLLIIISIIFIFLLLTLIVLLVYLTKLF